MSIINSFDASIPLSERHARIDFLTAAVDRLHGDSDQTAESVARVLMDHLESVMPAALLPLGVPLCTVASPSDNAGLKYIPSTPTDTNDKDQMADALNRPSGIRAMSAIKRSGVVGTLAPNFIVAYFFKSLQDARLNMNASVNAYPNPFYPHVVQYFMPRLKSTLFSGFLRHLRTFSYELGIFELAKDVETLHRATIARLGEEADVAGLCYTRLFAGALPVAAGGGDALEHPPSATFACWAAVPSEGNVTVEFDGSTGKLRVLATENISAGDSIVLSRETQAWHAAHCEATCEACAAPTKTVCGRCKTVYFCSRKCQKAALSLHKQACARLPV